MFILTTRILSPYAAAVARGPCMKLKPDKVLRDRFFGKLDDRLRFEQVLAFRRI